MPALPRKTQKIFGSSLTPTGNLAVWGSLAAGSPAYSSDLATIQSTAFLSGFNSALVGNRSPAVEDLNGLIYLVTQQLAYVLQSGIPEWDTSTVYYTGNYVRVAGVAYISLTDANVGNNPVTDTNNWISLADSIAPSPVTASAQARAWVSFDGTQIPGTSGGTLTVRSAYNVAAVNKIAGNTSLYQVILNGSFPDANYAVAIQCGQVTHVAADFARISARSNESIAFYSMGTGSAQGQSSDCNVIFYSLNALA